MSDLIRHTDTVFSHLCGGVVVRTEDRQSRTWRELHKGIAAVLREIACPGHEWERTRAGQNKLCRHCNAVYPT